MISTITETELTTRDGKTFWGFFGTCLCGGRKTEAAGASLSLGAEGDSLVLWEYN